MNRICSLLRLCVLLLGLNACSKAPPPAPSAPPVVPAERDQLHKLVESYWASRIDVQDVISPQALADARSIEVRYLDALASIKPEALDAESKLTYALFKRRGETLVEGFTYSSELLPLNPFSGVPLKLAAFAGDCATHPLPAAADYEAYKLRLEAYLIWTRQALANLREGTRRGYLMPRSLVERSITVFDRLSEEGSSNALYTPVRSMPASMAAQDQTRLTSALNALIANQVIPANRELRDYLQRSYWFVARTGLSAADMPLGRAWYSYRIKRALGLAADPAEIHRNGVTQVDLLRTRIQALQGAATVGERPADLEALALQVHEALPTLFTRVPQSGFELRSTEWLRDPSEPLVYQPRDPQGRRPAILYARAGPSATPMSIGGFLQAGEPGRHLQAALQQENTDLPRFRRYSTDTGFGDAWAAYAVSLGEELGVYRDEPARFDAALVELKCAAAMVVDTGIHAQGWTRTQALDYLRAQAVIGESDAQSMIDGYAAMPGDALACGVGGLKLSSLRARAQQLLGARFDLREFHAQILNEGAMPMDMLEARMKAWMEGAR